MSSNDNKPGADAPGEKKSLVPLPVEQEAAHTSSVPAGTHAPRHVVIPQKRQAEAVLDPALNAGAPGTETPMTVTHLPHKSPLFLIQFAERMATKQGKRLPQNIVGCLIEALARVDATAPALRASATRIGVLAEGPDGIRAESRDQDPAYRGGDSIAEYDRATIRAVALARHLRERLGMSRLALLPNAERRGSRVSRPPKLSNSRGAAPTVSDDTGRRS